ncbi:hypothetical protein SCHPADRAFT_1002817 [Schizopora paradoxa]|uniref:Uncharacterized protein n=1 Tax=Schizopora paradoxa TaxID=27342 RepID=A0A0H2R1J0_9AGAM|nr:hypothetical protein SCHPADRAFT_1002817 [Schizopora paradoxa]
MTAPFEFTLGSKSNITYESPRRRPLPQPRCFPKSTLQRTFSVEQRLICPPVTSTARLVFPVECRPPDIATRILFDYRAVPENQREGDRERGVDYGDGGQGGDGENDSENGHEQSDKGEENGEGGGGERREEEDDFGDEEFDVGRPEGSYGDLSRKGYSLESVWSVKYGSLTKLKTTSYDMVDSFFRLDRPLTRQNETLVRKVIRKIKDRHPAIASHRFENDWIYKDLLRHALKNIRQRNERNMNRTTL